MTESKARNIPDLPSEVWDYVRELNRGHSPITQQSDVDDDFGRAVKGRKSPDCNKYKECSKACEDAKSSMDLQMSLTTDQVTEFIKSNSLLFLLDNTFSLICRPGSKNERNLSLELGLGLLDLPTDFDRASFQCQMIVLVGKSYIDELLLYVPQTCMSNVADHITQVYYKYKNETVGILSDEFIERHRKKMKKREWKKLVFYIGYDKKEEPRVNFSVVLVNNTFYWLTADNIVSQKRIDKNDLTFPIKNFVFRNIGFESTRLNYFEIQRGNVVFKRNIR